MNDLRDKLNSLRGESIKEAIGKLQMLINNINPLKAPEPLNLPQTGKLEITGDGYDDNKKNSEEGFDLQSVGYNDFFRGTTYIASGGIRFNEELKQKNNRYLPTTVGFAKSLKKRRRVLKEDIGKLYKSKSSASDKMLEFCIDNGLKSGAIITLNGDGNSFVVADIEFFPITDLRKLK